jgi:hypothetical protein
MYIRDDIADRIILENPKIRDAVRGRSVMLVVPGHAAYVLTNFMLMVGWMGCSLAVYGLSGESQMMLVYCLAAGLIDVTLLSFLSYQVISGHPRARRRLYIYSIGLSAVCVAVSLMSILYGRQAVLVVSFGGTLASLVAVRILSGTGYAMCAAFFRAKRALRESFERSGRS